MVWRRCDFDEYEDGKNEGSSLEFQLIYADGNVIACIIVSISG